MLKRLTKQYVLFGVLGATFIVGILIFLSYPGSPGKIFKFKTSINYEAFTVVPLFFLALVQITYNERLRKTDFLRSYAEEFFTNKALYTAFHQLVYMYIDFDFDRLNVAIEEAKRSGRLTDRTPKPFFLPLTRSFGNDGPGSRLYHPCYFQGSEEERRLDMLIGYFDMLGYHHSQGYLSIEDIAGSFGHYLNILSKRKVIRQVRAVYRYAIRNQEYADKNGRIQPFRHFEALMCAIEEFNARIEWRIDRSFK